MVSRLRCSWVFARALPGLRSGRGCRRPAAPPSALTARCPALPASAARGSRGGATAAHPAVSHRSPCADRSGRNRTSVLTRKAGQHASCRTGGGRTGGMFSAVTHGRPPGFRPVSRSEVDGGGAADPPLPSHRGIFRNAPPNPHEPAMPSGGPGGVARRAGNDVTLSSHVTVPSPCRHGSSGVAVGDAFLSTARHAGRHRNPRGADVENPTGHHVIVHPAVSGIG